MDLAGRKKNLKKIIFELELSEWCPYGSETLWAKSIGNNHFRLKNTPFYARDVSFEDEVSVNKVNDKLIYNSIVRRGGHSTYRILFHENIRSEIFKSYWGPIEGLGCTYEAAGDRARLLAVDVPPETDIYKVYALLEKGEADGIWGFEEGHCGHPIEKDSM